MANVFTTCISRCWAEFSIAQLCRNRNEKVEAGCTQGLGGQHCAVRTFGLPTLCSSHVETIDGVSEAEYLGAGTWRFGPKTRHWKWHSIDWPRSKCEKCIQHTVYMQSHIHLHVHKYNVHVCVRTLTSIHPLIACWRRRRQTLTVWQKWLDLDGLRE